MKKIICILVVGLIVVGGLVGCGISETPKVDTPQQQEEPKIDDEKVEEKQFPQAKDDTIMIEGMEETITLNLLDGSGKNFITYVPEDLLVETVSAGEGDAYWFYANFGGNKREDVYLQLFFFPPTLDSEPKLVGERGLLTAQGLEMEKVEDGEEFYPWSVEEYISKTDETKVYLGVHQDQYFMLKVSYPAEFGDGFLPRVNKVLEHFYWVDTETYLVEAE